MKLPEKGPDLRLLDGDLFANVVKSEQVRDLFQKANYEYWPWEEFKYKTSHVEHPPEVLWGFLEFLRRSSMKPLPFSDINEKPFLYWLPDKVQEDLHYIDQSFGGGLFMQGTDLIPETKERYIISSLMEEAIASSQIEGAATTRPIAKEMLRKNLKPRDRSQQMILNNYKTILTIKETIDQPMSLSLIHDLHQKITMNTLDDPNTSGRFRKEDEPIHVMDQHDGVILHIPPPANRLPELVTQLCDFANQEQSEIFIHPVVTAIILHFWLAYLHPYVDGNGRTARTLFYWYMLKHKYWLFEYLSVSRVFLKSKQQYQKAFLHSEQDENDLTYFLTYHLRAIRLAIRELQDYLKRKQLEYRETLSLLRQVSWMNHRQQALIQHALKHPEFIYTIEFHKNSHSVVYQTARADLLTLAEKGYLEKIKAGRTFRFRIPKDLPDLLNT